MITVSFNGEIYVYKGLSTDEKPLENVEKSSLFVETDTLRAFKFDKVWKEVTTEAMSQVQQEVLTSALENKVTAVEGEGLSENNFTDEYKEKLDNTLTEVEASDIVSTGIESGKVLTADGEGGTSWQNASGGSSDFIIYVDSDYILLNPTTKEPYLGKFLEKDYPTEEEITTAYNVLLSDYGLTETEVEADKDILTVLSKSDVNKITLFKETITAGSYKRYLFDMYISNELIKHDGSDSVYFNNSMIELILCQIVEEPEG